MFRIFGIATVAFVIAAVATYAVVFFGTLGAWQVLGVVDRDGGGSMGVAFVIAPTIALTAGTVGAVVAGVRAHRRRLGAAVGIEGRRRDVSRFALVVGVLAGGFAGYFVAKLAFWLVGPIRYDAMWKALAHAWAPLLIMLAGAAVGGLIARRMSRS